MGTSACHVDHNGRNEIVRPCTQGSLSEKAVLFSILSLLALPELPTADVNDGRDRPKLQSAHPTNLALSVASLSLLSLYLPFSRAMKDCIKDRAKLCCASNPVHHVAEL
jgi:hypothetical protein